MKEELSSTEDSVFSNFNSLQQHTGLTKFRNADQPNQLTFRPCNMNILPSTLKALFDRRNKKKVSIKYLYNQSHARRFYLSPTSCHIYQIGFSFNHEIVSISEKITTCKVNQTNRLKMELLKSIVCKG